MTDKEIDRSYILAAIAIILFLYLLWKKKKTPQIQTEVTSRLIGPAIPVDQNPSMDTQVCDLDGNCFSFNAQGVAQ